jgi:hypothetical protein
MKEYRSLRVHPDVVRFVQAAQKFCGLIETDQMDRNVWMRSVLIAVADLYAAIHYLPIPDLDAASIDPGDSFRLTSDAYREVFLRLGRILDDERFYADCSNITDFPGDPQTIGIGDLADDLADIYRDITPGLRAWHEDIDDYLPDIVFEWKEPSFRTHWGIHAVDALRALHSLVFA